MACNRSVKTFLLGQTTSFHMIQLVAIVLFSMLLANSGEAAKALPFVGGKYTRVAKFGGAKCPVRLNISAIWVNTTMTTPMSNETFALKAMVNTTFAGGAVCTQSYIYIFNSSMSPNKSSSMPRRPSGSTPPPRGGNRNAVLSKIPLPVSAEHLSELLGNFLRAEMGSSSNGSMEGHRKSNVTIAKFLFNSTCAQANLTRDVRGVLLNATEIRTANITSRRGLNVTLFKTLLGNDSTRAIFMSRGSPKNMTLRGCLFADGTTVPPEKMITAAMAIGLSDDSVDTRDEMASTSPTPTPGGNVTSTTCFPGDASVELEHGMFKKMSELVIGDRVRVAHNRFSPIFMFTHKVESLVSNFITLKTRSHEISMTPGHFLYVNGQLIAAEDVKVGDKIYSASSEEEVQEIISRQRMGLYNPQTLDGDIIVDGIRASCYTSTIEPSAAHGLLTPLRAAFRGMGIWTDAFEQGSDMFAPLF